MTLPDTLTPNYQSQNVRPPRRPWGFAEILCWVLVVILCSVTVALVVTQRDAEKAIGSDPSLTFVSKYAIAVHEINRGGAFGGPAADTEALKAVEKAARSPEDKLRAAIVTGELQGREAGLQKIDSLVQHYPEMAEDAATARDLMTGDAPEANRATTFHDRYHWFSDLAQSVERPAGDPKRAGMLHSAMVVTLSYFAVLLAALGMIVVGLALLVIAVVLLLMKRLRLRFTPLLSEGGPADRRNYLYGFTLYLAGLVLVDAAILVAMGLNAPKKVLLILGISQLVVFIGAFTFGLVLPLFRGQSAAEWRAAFGLHLGQGFFREVGSGIVGYIAGLPVLAVGFIITALLATLAGTKPTHPIENSLDKSFLTLVFVFVLASVWAPITEELMFRGALFAHLRERFGWWISAPVVAFVFAIIHPQGWIAVPTLGAIALVLAGIREWRGSIIGCMTAHALHNTITLAVALLMIRGL